MSVGMCPPVRGEKKWGWRGEEHGEGRSARRNREGEGLRSVGGVPFLALPSPALRSARLSNFKKVTDGTTTRSSDAPAHHRIGNDGPHEIAKPSTCASSTTIIILQKMLLGSCPSEPNAIQLGYGPPSEQRPWHLFFVHRRGVLHKIKKVNKNVIFP